ncbi:MAG: phage/plasmid primase, P4 family [Pseudomonadota bacterium]
MGIVEDIQKQVADRVKQEGEPPPSEATPIITSRFISDCLKANELGDAQLYIALNQGKRLYNQTSTEWMCWTGNHWDIDRGSADAMAAMEGVVFEYLKEAHNLVDIIAKEVDSETKKKLIDRQKKIYRRVERLRSIHGSNNCLTFTTRCHDRMVVNSDDFDRDPWALPLKNGVVDLRTGELIPGKPESLLYKACPNDWTGIETPCPIWEQAVLDIMAGSQEMSDFLRRLLGYSITGLTTEHILPVFYGKGRNGKSLIVETVREVMGPLAAPIRSEMLLDQSFMKSSSGPSPDIMALKGLRIAFANETDAGRRISPSQVKLLTGGDSLVGRNPHDKYETRFSPTHSLFLLTNNKPHAPADEYALWKRLLLIPFPISFVDTPVEDDERPIDKELPDKLKPEASGILAWLVRGCLEWQQGGIELPSLVRDATGGYRRDEDPILDFVDEKCEQSPEYRISSADLYDAFKDWYAVNVSKKYVMSHKVFSTSMKLKFKSAKISCVYFYGLRLIDPPGS